jgi:hypothetical protein
MEISVNPKTKSVAGIAMAYSGGGNHLKILSSVSELYFGIDCENCIELIKA